VIIIDLQDLIYIIPDLINLFLSGFVFMTLYNWLTNTQMDLYLIGIWSLFINSLIKALCSVLHSVILTKINFSESSKILIYVVVAVLLSIFVVKVRDTKCFKKIISKLHQKTINRDILNDVIDYDKRTSMMVYPKNSDLYYSGMFRLHEEKGAESYITLINYALCSKKDDEIIRDYSEQKSAVIINLQDIERIELFYEKESETWSWLNKYNKTTESNNEQDE